MVSHNLKVYFTFSVSRFLSFVLGDEKPKKYRYAGQHHADDLREGAVTAVATKSTDSIERTLGPSGKPMTVGQSFIT